MIRIVRTETSVALCGGVEGSHCTQLEHQSRAGFHWKGHGESGKTFKQQMVNKIPDVFIYLKALDRCVENRLEEGRSKVRGKAVGTGW